MNLPIHISITFLLTLLFQTPIITAQLHFAFELFRHGARAPSELLSNNTDIFGEQWESASHLTAVGLRQHYILGHRNRLRYIETTSLLNKTFNPKELIVFSTDSDRTILSANAQLQGLYPQGTGHNLTSSQAQHAVPPNDNALYKDEQERLQLCALPELMELIPVKTFIPSEHLVNLFSPSVCPKMSEILNNQTQQTKLKNYINTLHDKYSDVISKLTNTTVDNVMYDYDSTCIVLDTFISEYYDGKDLTKFTNAGIDIEAFLTDAFGFYLLDMIGNGEGHDKLTSISMTYVFKQLIKWMDMRIEMERKGKGNESDYTMPKFVMYSGHDSTLGAFEGFMKHVFGCEVKYPKFASSVFVELWKGNDGEYNVEYYFNDEFILSMKYGEFKTEVNKNLQSDESIQTFCEFNNKKESSFNYFKLFGICLIIVMVVLVVIMVYLIMIRYKIKANKLNNVAMPKTKQELLV
jgi:hypothetical protein